MSRRKIALLCGLILLTVAGQIYAIENFGDDAVLPVLMGFGLIGGLVNAFRSSEYKKEVVRMQEFSAEHGWNYQQTNNDILGKYVGGVIGLGRGFTNNVLTGETQGHAFAAFNYIRTAGKDTLTDGVVIMTVHGPDLPLVYLMPETINDITLSREASHDTENNQFNKRWVVEAADRRGASNVLSPQMIEHLLSSSDFPHGYPWSLWFEPNAIGTHSPEPLTVSDLKIMTEALPKIAALLPPWVLDSTDSRPAGS